MSQPKTGHYPGFSYRKRSGNIPDVVPTVPEAACGREARAGITASGQPPRTHPSRLHTDRGQCRVAENLPEGRWLGLGEQLHLLSGGGVQCDEAGRAGLLGVEGEGVGRDGGEEAGDRAVSVIAKYSPRYGILLRLPDESR